MNSIESIEHFIEELNKSEPGNYASIINRLDIPLNEFTYYASWSDKGYTRNCIARTDDYELILLCWDTDAETPIHGHGGEDCWVYQVRGHIEEVRVKKDSLGFYETNRMILKPGRLTYMHDRMGFHKLKNRSGHKAMTLHIYASPIDSCRVYNEDTNCFEMKEMVYDTQENVLIDN
jgi:cysteine dioxygenase